MFSHTPIYVNQPTSFQFSHAVNSLTSCAGSDNIRSNDINTTTQGNMPPQDAFTSVAFKVSYGQILRKFVVEKVEDLAWERFQKRVGVDFGLCFGLCL